MEQVYQIFVIKMRIKRNEKIPICKYKLQLSFPRNNERERKREEEKKMKYVHRHLCERLSTQNSYKWH